mgnify:FL=1
MKISNKSKTIQEEYYKKTADSYNNSHCGYYGEHNLALRQLFGLIDFLEVKSILDVGSGTGRVISFLKIKI